MIYFCCDERRRAMVRDHAPVDGVDYNGIDFLEIDTEADTQSARQHRLRLHFLKTTSLDQITVNNVLIEGGERIRGIVVKKVEVGAGPSSKTLTIDVDNPSDASGQTIAGVGDYSIYTLRLVTDARHAGGSGGGGQTPAGFDSVLSAVQFSFKIECPSDFDCAPERLCPPALRTEPEIDYLAKDYYSFRQLMLDRLSVLMPQWTERNPADEGIALVELLAYVGDHLSYQQDVIATEAYLDTARRRISVRRHALLVDYFMHDGCNARTWIHLQAGADDVLVKQGTRLITHVDGVKAVLNPDTDIDALRQVDAASTQSFETMHDVVLFTAHNQIKFYTWGDEHCCLPAGSTQATLDGDLPNLKAGDVLVFEEIAGAVNGVAADANPSHRHAVRLTKVDREIQQGDGVQLPLTDPMAADPSHRCTQIEWHVDDALPFALCISAPVDTEYRNRISVARGNIVLADHGLTLTEDIGAPALPDEDLATVASSNTSCCEHTDVSPALPPFRPRLDKQPLTQVAPFNPKGQSQIPANRDPDLSASAAFRWEMRDVLPAIILRDSDGRIWRPRRDLLSSDAFKEEFVAEIDEDGRATLRFGDDQHGLQPAPQVEFAATYRTGNGAAGNLGADSLVHVVT
ncbi:MAG: hypothetical protein QOK48_3111, partial [Blastocatellia bacterium]|nr:hypothetical protein [Blastocatellia bacterium]